jgi:hypothetical protein
MYPKIPPAMQGPPTMAAPKHAKARCYAADTRHALQVPNCKQLLYVQV